MSGVLCPPVSDSVDLLRRYADERRREDQREIIERFRPLARKLALRYARGSEPIDDLEQVALLGLVKALERFDPDRGFAFTSFAVPTILGELRRSFRDTGWAAHVPRALQERVAEVRSFADGFFTTHGRPPRAREIAAALGCGDEEVAEALAAADALAPVSFDAPSADDEGGSVGDRFGDVDPGYQRVEDRAAIVTALPALSELQRTVLGLRLQDNLRQSDIAECVGVSQMQVSRLLRSGLQRLGTVALHHSSV